jgi:site-specific recombinase XerD
MSAFLVPTSGVLKVPAALRPDFAVAVDLAKAEKAPSTRKAYGTDFRLFAVYCDARGVGSLPALPETVAAYLASEAQSAKPSTISRRLAAIRYAHKLAGLDAPTDQETVKATMRGIRRTLGGSKNKKTPAVAPQVVRMVAHMPAGLIGLRDRAVLLLGFAGAFRRSELVALDVADLAENQTGLVVNVRGSKTDQERQGEIIAIARGRVTCPVEALRVWLHAARIEAGPIFRPIDRGGTVRDLRLTCRSVANIVKAGAERAGLDSTSYSGHSLRSGFLTSAAGNGASIFKMMDVSRHKSVDTLRGYVRDAELFKDHAGAGLL